MTTITIAVLCIGILILAIAKKYSNKNKEVVEEEIFNLDNEPDFEKDFFARTEQGEKSQILLSLASVQDCVLIRSLLYADGIPSHVEGEHMNNIYGGITGTMTSVVATKVYILCSDYDKAVDIIKNSKITSMSGVTIFEKQ